MIFIEDGRIKLGGTVLPGLVKSIEVTETAKVDEQEVEGSAAKPKQATGYEDAKINIELIIDDTETSTKFERYAVLRQIFRTPGQNVPQPVPIVCEDAAAHGVERVIFKKLTHKGENKKSQLAVSLELWEYAPQPITASTVSSTAGTSGSSSSSASSGSSSGGAQTPAASGSLNEDYLDYLDAGRGSAPAGDASKKKRSLQAKRKKSPAVDDANAVKALNRIQKMPY